MTRRFRISAVLLAAGWPALLAQSSPQLPGCEAQPEIRQVIDEKLSQKALKNMKFTEQVALRRQLLEGLIARYPREMEPHRQLIQATLWWDTGQYPALQEQYRLQAAEHAQDPLPLFLAGMAFSGRDTPRSIEYLEKAQAGDPHFVWPALWLAKTYASGKRVDKKKAGDELAVFFAACPSSTDSDALHVLSRIGSADLQRRVAAALRTRLAAETDPKRLEDYAVLWGLEFRVHPPEKHDKLRKQLAGDLARLEALNRKPDAEWMVFLLKGYKQSGATPETITAFEDRVVQSYPHSPEAYEIVSTRWEKEHKEPEDQGDAAAWAKYDADYRVAVKDWIGRFTESRTVQHTIWFEAISEDPHLTEREGLPALDEYLAEITEYQQPQYWSYVSAASFLIEHKWQPQRALDLMARAEPLLAAAHVHRAGDNQSAEEQKLWADSRIYEEQNRAELMLKAAKLVQRPAVVTPLKASIEAEPPADVRFASDYWLNRGRLAALEGRKTDALTYYQKALHSRTKLAEPYRGKLRDDLGDEAQALWKEMGGSDTAWVIWSKPPAGKSQELAEGRWEKPVKAMPAFEMPDLTGKTWRAKNLEGKSVLINVWATWCGPCQAELPKLEKLYQKVKDRADVQILTFNIDQDLGLVAPFVKEKSYTFPVLPAYGFVVGLIDMVAIPQNWILDTKGAWRWSQLGYDASDAQWAETMIGKLESVKAAAP